MSPALPPEGGEVLILREAPWSLAVTRRDGPLALRLREERLISDLPDGRPEAWARSFPLTLEQAAALVAEPGRARPLVSCLDQLRREEQVTGEHIEDRAREAIERAALGPVPPAGATPDQADADRETLCLEPWMLAIERRGDAFALAVHIESSFASWDRSFPLSRAAAEALAADRARRLVLHDALHPLLQSERARPLPPGLAERLIEAAARAPVEGLDARLRALTPDGEAEREARRLLPELEEIAWWLERLARFGHLLPGAGRPAPPEPSAVRAPYGEEIRLDREFEAHAPLMRAICAEPVTVHRDPRGPDGSVTREYRWRGRLIRIDHGFDGSLATTVTAAPAEPGRAPGGMEWLSLESLVEPEAHPRVLGAPPARTDAETFRRRLARLPEADLPPDMLGSLPVDAFWRRW